MDDFIPDSEAVLYLDIGNSTIKAGYREGLKWKRPEAGRVHNAETLLDWINEHRSRFQFIVISSVVPKVTRAVTDKLQNRRVRVLSVDDIPGDLINYKTPETLGIDRFFACYGAVAHTRKPVVVIDAGTACTLDYMSADSAYQGGIILPGIGILEKSVKEYAPNLPEVERAVPEEWPGRSTRESLQWGLAGMMRNSILVYLEKYASAYGDYELVLTGGDAGWMDSLLDQPAKVRPMLVFEGMQRYLETHL